MKMFSEGEGLPATGRPCPAPAPTPPHIHLLDLCEEADRNGDGRLSTATVRRLLAQMIEAAE